MRIDYSKSSKDVKKESVYRTAKDITLSENQINKNIKGKS